MGDATVEDHTIQKRRRCAVVTGRLSAELHNNAAFGTGSPSLPAHPLQPGGTRAAVETVGADPSREQPADSSPSHRSSEEGAATSHPFKGCEQGVLWGVGGGEQDLEPRGADAREARD